jgi:hypothetical protein
MVAIVISPSTTTAFGPAAPTAKIPDCGGFKIAEKLEVPYMPKLVTAKLSPFSSSWRLQPLS